MDKRLYADTIANSQVPNFKANYRWGLFEVYAEEADNVYHFKSGGAKLVKIHFRDGYWFYGHKKELVKL